MIDKHKISVMVHTGLIILGIIALLAVVVGSTGCATSKFGDHDLPMTLCALDFKDKTCWREKSRNEGFTFGELELQNSRCGGGAPDHCWFAIGENDLARLLQRSEQLDEMKRSCKP